MEIFYKFIVLVLVILAFVFAYRDENLSGVKHAWMYKTCVALTIVRGILFMVELFRLW